MTEMAHEKTKTLNETDPKTGPCSAALSASGAGACKRLRRQLRELDADGTAERRYEKDADDSGDEAVDDPGGEPDPEPHVFAQLWTESIGAATFVPETTSLSETGTGGCSTPQSGQYRAI